MSPLKIIPLTVLLRGGRILYGGLLGLIDRSAACFAHMVLRLNIFVHPMEAAEQRLSATRGWHSQPTQVHPGLCKYFPLGVP
jgi:hypothetical protein